MKNLLFACVGVALMLAVVDTKVVTAQDVAPSVIEITDLRAVMPSLAVPVAITAPAFTMVSYALPEAYVTVTHDAFRSPVYQVYSTTYGVRNPLPDYDIRLSTDGLGSNSNTDASIHNYSYGVPNPLPSFNFRFSRE